MSSRTTCEFDLAVNLLKDKITQKLKSSVLKILGTKTTGKLIFCRFRVEFNILNLFQCYFRQLRNGSSLITSNYSVIIYKEYNGNYVHAIKSRICNHLDKFGNKNTEIHVDEKGKTGIKR